MTRTRGRFADVVIDAAMPLPELAAVGDEDSTRDEIRVDVAAPFDCADWFHQWPAADGGVWLHFGETPSGYLLRFPNLLDVHVTRGGLEIALRPEASVPDGTVRHLLLNQVLPLVLSLTGRLVLHAGAVAWNGRAVLIMGPSGAGKSTMVAACAQAGAAVMADDSVVVEQVGGRWLAHPSYASVRLWPASFAHLGLGSDLGPASHAPVAHFHDKRVVSTGGVGWQFCGSAVPVSLLMVLAPPETPPRPQRPPAVDVLCQVFRLDLRDAPQSARVFTQLTQLVTDVRVVRVTGRVEDRRPDDLIRMVADMA